MLRRRHPSLTHARNGSLGDQQFSSSGPTRLEKKTQNLNGTKNIRSQLFHANDLLT